MSGNRIRRTSVERARQAYRRQVRQLIGKSFGLSETEMKAQDDVWDAWCQYLEKNERGRLSRAGDLSWLRSLFYHEVKDCFRARALAIWLAPFQSWGPFAWNSTCPDGSYASDLVSYPCFLTEKVKLSPKLWETLGGLLEISLQAAGWGKPPLRKDVLDEATKKRDKAYNQLILQVLGALPEKSALAKRLFESYRLEYPFFSARGEDQSFYDLLKSPGPLSWKKRADQERQAWILKQGPTHWKELLEGYAHDLQIFFREPWTKSPDTTEVLAGQINWIVELAEANDALHPVSRIWLYDSFHHGLEWLKGDQYLEVRRRFARHLLIRKTGAPSLFLSEKATVQIEHLEGEKLVQGLLDELGKSDPELSEALESLLASHHEKGMHSEARHAEWRRMMATMA